MINHEPVKKKYNTAAVNSNNAVIFIRLNHLRDFCLLVDTFSTACGIDNLKSVGEELFQFGLELLEIFFCGLSDKFIQPQASGLVKYPLRSRSGTEGDSTAGKCTRTGKFASFNLA